MATDSFKARGELITFGDWQIDLRDDEFADIKYRGHNVLRSIRCVVRDRDWNTADLVIDDKEITNNSIKLNVHSTGFDSSFAGQVIGEFENETAKFSMNLKSQQDFQTNRTGLIVLHEPEVAGVNLGVKHSNGDVEDTKFPIDISPNQPVLDISGLHWEQNNNSIDIEFSGDVFEMEDQRNWTDASYKTYSRPLANPFPYSVKSGETIWQEITVRSSPDSDLKLSNEELEIKLNDSGHAPALQIAASTAPGARPIYKEFVEAELVELDLKSTNWKAALDRSQISGLPIDVRVVDNENLEELIHLLNPDQVIRLALFDEKQHVSTKETNAKLHAALARANKSIPVVSGARSHFTELNREQHQILPGAEAICFSSTPLFHSLTTAQLVESVAMQRLTAQQAVGISGGKPVHVGPVTLRPRFNNVATAAQPGPIKPDLSEGYGAEFTDSADPRQSSRELAAWAIASFAAFTVPGVSSLTLFESWGTRGIRNSKGVDFPVADALRALRAMSGKRVSVGADSEGKIWVIATESTDVSTLLATNLHSETVRFTVNHLEKATSVELGPFEWARLEL